MDIKGLKTALPICFDANVTMLIHGPHGIGKSQGVRQAIEGQNLGKVFDFRLGQMADTGDIIGLLDVEESKEYCTFKIPQRVFEVKEYCENNPDKYGVLFFDEMNRTTKDILQAIFQIVLDYELNGLKFPKNMKAVCAINPATDDYNVLDFDDKAFADRFCHVKFEPSVKDWLEYASKQNVDASITGFIGEHNEMLKKDCQDYDLPVEPSPRSWFMIDDIKRLSKGNKAIFQELLMGIVGNEAAAMYLDYCSNFHEAIKGIEILDDYKKHKKKVKQFSNVNSDRSDILKNICDQIKLEIEKVEKLPAKWEKNLADFLCDIPKDIAHGVIQEFFEIPSFTCTESDEEYGLSGTESKAGKKLVKHFENSTVKTESKTEEKKESEDLSDDIPF